MKQTAMQELRSILIEESERYRKSDMRGEFVVATKILTKIELELLEKEKGQIIDARNDALRDKYTSVYNDLITYGQAKIETKTSEQYYNQTYLEESR